MPADSFWLETSETKSKAWESVPGQGNLEDLVSRHKGRQSGQWLFARASDTDQQSITTWRPNYAQDLHGQQQADMYRIIFVIV